MRLVLLLRNIMISKYQKSNQKKKDGIINHYPLSSFILRETK